MNKVYLSENANSSLIEYILSSGREISFVKAPGRVDQAISSHPDIYMCKLGAGDTSFLFKGDPKKLSPTYPLDTIYNAACTGKYFIHRLDCTDRSLMEKALSLSMIPIDVAQGYTKCSTVIVNENSLITADEGIEKACTKAGLSVLLIASGHVELKGFPYGFLGGASGRIGNEIIFNGDLSAHPDFQKVISFINSCGLRTKWFCDYPLTDIGSIL